MPRVTKAVDIGTLEKESQKDYFDRHTPRVICEAIAKKEERFMVKVKMGEAYSHPDEPDHYIRYIQLWNRETLLAEANFTAGMLGKPEHVEIDFYIFPNNSMNLSVMACCTKHGLWQSESAEVKVLD